MLLLYKSGSIVKAFFWSSFMHIGTVKRFNKIKGYGFILPDEGDTEVFVHFSEIQLAGYKELKEGQRIRYESKKGDRGEFATKVVIIEDDTQ